jgi:hypothetical protein
MQKHMLLSHSRTLALSHFDPPHLWRTRPLPLYTLYTVYRVLHAVVYSVHSLPCSSCRCILCTQFTVFFMPLYTLYTVYRVFHAVVYSVHSLPCSSWAVPPSPCSRFSRSSAAWGAELPIAWRTVRSRAASRWVFSTALIHTYTPLIYTPLIHASHTLLS